MAEFFLSRMFKSEKWFYKSLYSYRKNYFSIIHSGSYDLTKFKDSIQYMLANTLKKNIDKETLVLSAEFLYFCALHKGRNNSQFLQDLFVLFFLKNTMNGFFVEFGACDGIDYSNTLFLEKEMGWNGILAEPDKFFFDNLKVNRKCNCCDLAVYKESGHCLKFSHVIGDSKLSTITKYQNNDVHKANRSNVEYFEVNTITLDELLDLYSAPDSIDYISIDTEGSELDIIRNFNFEKRRIRCWTIEHNHNVEVRNEVFTIMSQFNYVRVFEGFSECDDWFVDREVYNNKIERTDL